MTTAEELRAWRCPTEGYGYSFDGSELNGVCGEPVAGVAKTLSATYRTGVDDAASYALAHGVDPGPGRTQEVPVAYDVTVTCARGHEHFAGREEVGPSARGTL